VEAVPADTVVKRTDTTAQTVKKQPAGPVQQQSAKSTPVRQRPLTSPSGQRFSVQADTVDVQHKKRTGAASSSVSVKASTPKRFYTVEIGAFRLQSNILRHRQQLAERFQLPVRVLYDSTIRLTRVCVGTFSSRTLAVEFMKKMQARYPADYPDGWVSYWTK
jgi:hypothetical protein